MMSEEYLEKLRSTGVSFWKNNPGKLEERGSKISKSLVGKKKSEETKSKISESRKGQPAWNKGLTKDTSEIVKQYSEAKIGKKRTSEQKKYISDKTKEAMNSVENKDRIHDAIAKSNTEREKY